MMDVVKQVIAALIISLPLCLSTVKLVGVMQQSGYKGKPFFKWLKGKDNLQYNRLAVLALCLALSTAIVSLCFSFLGTKWAVLLSAAPFLGLSLCFFIVDRKYALKVPFTRTGRFTRLWWIYYVVTSFAAYLLIAICAFLAKLNGSQLYALIAYVPVSILPLLLPVLLVLANAATGVFENTRNGKFVKRAGQVLDETKILRVAVVGSYGKTSVKNILKTILSEKYSVVETPASFNTPMGIAKTVLSPEFADKEVFLAEMGARKVGDIAELCALVKPDYTLFTGVCAQHISTFESEERILQEKSVALQGVTKAVCGESLKGKVEGVIFAGESQIEDVNLCGEYTAFTLLLQGEKIQVKTSLLGRAAAENIAMAATLCLEMGLSLSEIERGIAKLQPIPHRLQYIQANGVHILDDGYNCNIRGAGVALEVLASFAGRKCVVTPGIVECGVLEEELNARLGAEIAKYSFERVILVGDTLVGAVKKGYLDNGGREENVSTARTLAAAQETLAGWIEQGDCVLFLNDLPDVF